MAERKEPVTGQDENPVSARQEIPTITVSIPDAKEVENERRRRGGRRGKSGSAGSVPDLTVSIPEMTEIAAERNRLMHLSTRSVVLMILVFLCGLAILLYPVVSSLWNGARQEQLISDYSGMVGEIPKSDLSAEWDRAHAYNAALLPSILPDSFTIGEAEGEEDEEYMACLNLNGDEMMGYVEIPKINVKLAIYHTTTEEVLQKGAGHLQGSSLPVGGESTHAVIAAHRGLPSASMFTDLDQMEEGDHFLLYILDDVLAYEVDQILVVEPDETEALSVVEGEDLATLLTCTPYGVNTQRLLVRGHRIPYEEEMVEEESATIAQTLQTNYLRLALAGLFATLAVILILVLVSRRRRKKGQA